MKNKSGLFKLFFFKFSKKNDHEKTWPFFYYLGFVKVGSPSLAVLLVWILVLGVEEISSAVQEYKLTHVIATNNSLNKKLAFIKNQFKN